MLSGGGRTMVNLAQHAADGQLPAIIVLAIASSQCAGVDRARGLGIPCVVMPGVIPASELRAVLDAHRAEAVALAGYLKFLNVPAGFEGRVVNIHPSLLPRHGGKGMYGHHVHESVLKSGDRVSGCTVHLVDGEFDHGEVLLQRTCPVLAGDSAESLASRVFEQECLAYPEAISLLAASWGRSRP